MAFANLPGLTNILRDNRLTIVPPAPATESTFIVGTALDGPAEPVRVTSPQEAERIFGPFLNSKNKKNGASLVPAIYEAFQAGCSNIGVLRIGGKTASLVLTDGALDDLVKVKGLFPGDKYNAVNVEVTATELKVYGIKKDGDSWITDDATTPVPVNTYKLEDYDDYQSLIDAYNDDKMENNSVLELVDEVDPSDAIALGVTPKSALTGGENGVNPDDVELDGLLDDAFELLVDVEMDYVVFPDVQVKYDLEAQTVDYSLAVRVAQFCHDASERNRITLTAIPVKPLVNPSLANVKKLYQALMANPPTGFKGASVDAEGNSVDTGMYVTLTVGEAAFNAPRVGAYFGPFNIAYLGFASRLPADSATTNKSIPNVVGLRYKFSAAQADSLAGIGIVCLRDRFGRGIVVSDGTTAAKPDSDYRRFSTVRIVKAVIDVTGQVLDPFLGESGDIVAFNSMNTELENGFKMMRESGVIQDYAFQIISHPDELIQGRISIQIDIVPAFEIRQIQRIINLNKSL